MSKPGYVLLASGELVPIEQQMAHRLECEVRYTLAKYPDPAERDAYLRTLAQDRWRGPAGAAVLREAIYDHLDATRARKSPAKGANRAAGGLFD